MIIKKEQAKHLLALLDSSTREIDVSKLNKDGIEELDFAGLVIFPTPASISLTYGGEMVARAIKSLIDSGKLEAVANWDEHFRFIGTEILAMMESARRSGSVSEIAKSHLAKRGLCKEVYDRERKVDTIKLSDEAEMILDAFENIEPNIRIDAQLADKILSSATGPTEAMHMSFDNTEKEKLESMRALAYSVPNGDMAQLTGIGIAIKRVLENGAVNSDGDIIDNFIMDLVAECIDEDINDEAKAQLEMMGYIDSEGNLLPAGEALLELRALLKNPTPKVLFSFAMTSEMVDTILTIDKLDGASVEDIKKEMVDKKVKEFNELKEKYGRRLNEMPIKKRQILEKFLEAKEHMKWFEDNFDIHEYLFALEAFDLAKEVEDDENKKDIFILTDTGKSVVEKLKGDATAISSQAVKTLKLSKRAFDVPNRDWIMKAREEKLLGEFGASSRGEFFANLSDTIDRKPFVTKYEMEVFKKIPNRGMTLSQLLNEAKDEHDKEMMLGAVDMLEARGLIEVLSDGHIVETEAGELMDRALSGVPSGFGAAVTPRIYRVIKAVAEVGTLYEKEKKIRILPKHHKEAYKRSGLSAGLFEKTWVSAREAKFLGKNGVNEAGIYLLRAVEAMNRA